MNLILYPPYPYQFLETVVPRRSARQPQNYGDPPSAGTTKETLPLLEGFPYHEFASRWDKLSQPIS
jgi:hypothetical protein